MNRKSAARQIESLLLAALCATPCSAAAISGVCQRVEADDAFTLADRVKSDYFDDYYIRNRDGAYYIRATKRLSLTFTRAAKVLSGLERYAQFMPGYSRIRVVRNPDGAIYTAIRFQADFSFFESSFTNRVEILQSPAGYRQCWWQLQAHDPAVIEEFRRAPKVNHGYWRVAPAAGGGVVLRYFSVIKPPIPIPGFFYRYVVSNSYREVFEHLADRIRAESK